MTEKDPLIVYIRKADKKDFERLSDKDSPFSERDKKELFLMAMATGFRNGNRISFKEGDRDGTGFIRTEYLSDRDKSIIKAIAVSDAGNLEILLDKKKVYRIAEEYAAGGIKQLKEEVFGGEFGSYPKRLEVELLEQLKKLPKRGTD